MAWTGLVGSWEVVARRVDGEEKWGERGVRSTAGGFLWRPGGTGGEEKGGMGWFRVWLRVEGKTGKREGAPGVAGDSSGGRHQPPADRHGKRRCHATGEGGGARVTRREQLTSGTG
jgi:hypothetical protein